ncbi:hypothetical protein SDC9_107963 [bioreactor metagenome]|uniref:Uncharacterized protein n=1 Tax=bioreactor metagenome TaxID=1076179 RepID=A0A645B6M5_9ZZZZ
MPGRFVFTAHCGGKTDFTINHAYVDGALQSTNFKNVVLQPHIEHLLDTFNKYIKTKRYI